MKKLKIEFWHKVFWFGSFLVFWGDRIETKGLDKLEDIARDDPEATQYQRKRGMIL